MAITDLVRLGGLIENFARFWLVKHLLALAEVVEGFDGQ
jgi:hypothetical protein